MRSSRSRRAAPRQERAFGTRGEQTRWDTHGHPGESWASKWAMRLLRPWSQQDGPGGRQWRPGSPCVSWAGFCVSLGRFLITLYFDHTVEGCISISKLNLRLTCEEDKCRIRNTLSILCGTKGLHPLQKERSCSEHAVMLKSKTL